jgi:hypothetical protein
LGHYDAAEWQARAQVVLSTSMRFETLELGRTDLPPNRSFHNQCGLTLRRAGLRRSSKLLQVGVLIPFPTQKTQPGRFARGSRHFGESDLSPIPPLRSTMAKTVSTYSGWPTGAADPNVCVAMCSPNSAIRSTSRDMARGVGAGDTSRASYEVDGHWHAPFRLRSPCADSRRASNA